MTRTVATAFAVAAIVARPLVAAAQTPPAQPAVDIVSTMPAIAQALGVSCDFCHVPRGTTPPAGQRPKKEIAKEMMGMVDEVNARVRAATGQPLTDATRVKCVTCHRGVTNPGQLSDIVIRTSLERGAADAVAQSYATMAYAYTRKYDNASAITYFEKALELDPNNGSVQGQLAQLRRLRRR